MTRRIFRYVVPIDDEPHVIALTSDPVAIPAGGGSGRAVEFWAEHTEGAPSTPRAFQVFGTGHPLPPGARHVGTCTRTGLGLVWHLYEVTR